MIKILNGKHGQDDRWEVIIINQMGKKIQPVTHWCVRKPYQIH